MIRLVLIYNIKIMRITFLLKTLLLCLLITAACNQSVQNEKLLVKGKNDSLLIINIPKAACNNCKQLVENGLSIKKGIKQSQLSLKKKELSIIYDPLAISEENLKLLVTNLTYQMPCK